EEGRGRRELLARAFDVPLELSPLVEHMEDGRLARIVLTDRTSTYRDGARVGGRRSRTAAGTSAKPGGANAATTNETPPGVRSSGRSLGFGVPGSRPISRMARRLSS